MNLKIAKSSLLIILELILIYHVVFIKFPYWSEYSAVQKYLSIILLIIILPHGINSIKTLKKSTKVKILICLYILLIILSAIINRNEMIMTNTLIGGIVFAINIYELIIIFSNTVKKKSFLLLVKSFLALTLLYVIITDLIIFINPDLFGVGLYFIGNKFTVGYKHLELIMLLMVYSNLKGKTVKQLSKVYILFFLILVVFVLLKIGSITGLIGILIFMIMILLNKKNLLYKPWLFFLLLIGSCLFALCAEILITFSPIQDIIVNILHKDLTLTGRLAIYRQIPNLLRGHLLFGYGYNTSYEVWSNFAWYMPNAQNGLINCIFEQGIVATIVLVSIACSIIGNVTKNTELRKIYFPLLAMLYVIAIIASFEITIDIIFIGWLLFFYTILDVKVN